MFKREKKSCEREMVVMMVDEKNSSRLTAASSSHGSWLECLPQLEEPQDSTLVEAAVAHREMRGCDVIQQYTSTSGLCDSTRTSAPVGMNV